MALESVLFIKTIFIKKLIYSKLKAKRNTQTPACGGGSRLKAKLTQKNYL